MLKNIWEDPHVDLHSKYMFFVAMPLSKLRWGCESWALKQTSIDDIDVFLHQSIRCIICINMTQVKEDKISNEKPRDTFYNIPDAHRLIAVKQPSFIEKIMRRGDSFFPKQLLTACVNHKRKAGGVLTTTKKSIVKALQLLYPPTKHRTDEYGKPCRDQNGKNIPEAIYMDRFGSSQTKRRVHRLGLPNHDERICSRNCQTQKQ